MIAQISNAICEMLQIGSEALKTDLTGKFTTRGIHGLDYSEYLLVDGVIVAHVV